MNKPELIFVALSEPRNIRSNIYGDILRYLSTSFLQIHIICLGNEGIRREGNLIYYSSNLRKWASFFKRIDKSKVSHIFITDFFIGGLISAYYSKAYHIPMVYRCGGPWKYQLTSISSILKTAIIALTKPIVIKNCKKIVYNSKAIVERRYRHDFEVVYNGVDTSLFKPMNLKRITQKVNLLYIGRILPEKGLDYLFKAVKDIKHMVHLSIVGDGELLQRYKMAYPFAQFYGRVEKKNLPFLINQHDILVLPSLVESFPNVVLESMACGKPVIATNVFGIPELVIDNYNGILVPPKNSEAIKKSIQSFLKNKKQIQVMGINAHKTVKERFEKEMQMKKLVRALFEDI